MRVVIVPRSVEIKPYVLRSELSKSLFVLFVLFCLLFVFFFLFFCFFFFFFFFLFSSFLFWGPTLGRVWSPLRPSV
jgi:hypothetical protein